MINYYDYLVVGAGIVGLTIAKQLSKKKSVKILVIDKEDDLGVHSSGRNSGVLHSGVYYSKGTLKSKVCSSGAKLLADYCYKNNLPIKKVGKVILATKEQDSNSLDILIKNAKDCNLNYELVEKSRLKEIEPNANDTIGRALYMPDVSVVDSKSVLNSILRELRAIGVEVHFGQRLIDVDIDRSIAITSDGDIAYGYFINAAGLYADQVAQLFNIGKRYSILPFKGSYYKLKEGADVFSNGLIYPVPDLSMPFLGVHTVKGVDNNTYFGPTSTPVFGRENYHGLNGLKLTDGARTIYFMINMYLKNKQGFRNYTHNEALNNIKSNFLKSAQKITPGLKESDLLVCNKAGIRSQLFDKIKNELVMDLMIKETRNSLHVLNAISPAFTASFSFAELIVDKILKNRNCQ